MDLDSLVLGLALSRDIVTTAIAQECADHEEAVLRLAAITGLPISDVRTRFTKWCATMPAGWRDCYRAIMAGDREWMHIEV